MGEDMVQLGEAAVKKHWSGWFEACDQGFHPTRILKDLVRIVALYVWSAGEVFMLSVRAPLSHLEDRWKSHNDHRHNYLLAIQTRLERDLDAFETRICTRFPLPVTTPTLSEIMTAINHDMDSTSIKTPFPYHFFSSTFTLVYPTEFETEAIWKCYLLNALESMIPKNLQQYWNKRVIDSFTLYFISLLHQTPLQLHDLF